MNEYRIDDAIKHGRQIDPRTAYAFVTTLIFPPGAQFHEQHNIGRGCAWYSKDVEGSAHPWDMYDAWPEIDTWDELERAALDRDRTRCPTCGAFRSKA